MPAPHRPRTLPATRAAGVVCTVMAFALGACDQQTAARSPPGDLKLCNTTSSRVGVAIGYQDSTGWTTEGWWNIAAQTCETLYKGTLSSRFYYVHAIDYDRGGEWAGKSVMCTTDKTFTIRGVQDCPRRGYKSTGFFEVDTQDANAWTIRLTDPSEGGAKGK
jgi:uncharacterized membrane protein